MEGYWPFRWFLLSHVLEAASLACGQIILVFGQNSISFE